MASLPVVRCTSSLVPLGCRHRERTGTGICTCARRVVEQTLWYPAEDYSTVIVVADLPDSHIAAGPTHVYTCTLCGAMVLCSCHRSEEK